MEAPGPRLEQVGRHELLYVDTFTSILHDIGLGTLKHRCDCV